MRKKDQQNRIGVYSLRFFIKIGLFFSLFAASVRGMAANYYFSSSIGDDSRTAKDAANPVTPWASIEKFNSISASLQAGDSVFFRCNDVFFGEIQLMSSGTLRSPIVLTNYGQGDLPIITGWVEVEGLDRLSEGVVRYDLSSLFQADPKKIHMVSVGGEVRQMGRYPNLEYMVYSTSPKETYIFHEEGSELLGFNGAEIVLRLNEWIIDRGKILSVDAKGVSFEKNTSYQPTEGYGFFIQNHINTLDQYGEWFHDAEENILYVYMGKASTPSEVKVSLLNHLLVNSGRISNVVVQGIHFSGSAKSSVFLDGGSNITISDCTISGSGEDGITIMNFLRVNITGNLIKDSFNNGIFLRYGTPSSTIANNTVLNTNLFPGMGAGGDQSGIGIYLRSDNGKVSGNTLRNIGYTGIYFGGNQTVVEGNWIDEFCLTKNDGGGIYTYEGKRNQSFRNRVVRDNTVLNGKGNRLGTRYQKSGGSPQVEGIYIDDNASGVEVSSNRIGFMSRNGINVHNGRTIAIHDNIVFDCLNLLSFSDDHLGDAIEGVIVRGNLLISSKESQKLVKVAVGRGDFSGSIVFKENKYFHVDSNEFPFQVGDRHLVQADWKEVENAPQIERLRSSPKLNHPAPAKSIDLLSLSMSKVNPINNSANIRKDGQTLLLQSDTSDTGVRLESGQLCIGYYYKLEIEVDVSSQVILQAYLRNVGSPWATLSETKHHLLEPGLNKKTWSFTNVVPADNSVLMLRFLSEVPTVKVTRLHWEQLPNPFPHESIDLIFDANHSLRKISIGENQFLFD
ncbi:right-handed parallel beta-helix repeat-containing protein [Lunatimonas lonarensis]|uniref:right-handed parallel beta-helix repeat-containing protein n=1 Tax=Lunatimonas lonarensis TaxID=1232681 RepID=UPI0012DF3844|nr:right-handed parallel beta-helix repeat-containing protein [Lunatimonas lonarensis]